MNFLDRVSENIKISNFIEIRPLTEEFHADGHTDGQKRNDGGNRRFCKFRERAKKIKVDKKKHLLSHFRMTESTHLRNYASNI